MPKVKGIFVAGTDTGAGKTLVTGLLARYLREKGYRVITQKWVQTGCRGFSGDIKSHLKLMRRDKSDIKPYLAEVNPYAFKLTASPHLAARLENKKIDARKIIKSFRVLSGKFDVVLIEGIGGALVPLNEKYLIIDIAKRLRLPVLVVAQNKLGAINHALLTVEALKRRKMRSWGIVFNNLQGENKLVLNDNPRIVGVFSKEIILGVLPWVDNLDRLYQYFIPIGERIRRQLR